MKTSRPEAEEVKFRKTQLVIKVGTPQGGLKGAHIDFISEMHFCCNISQYISAV